MSFSPNKVIKLRFELANKNFASNPDKNVLEISGLRVRAEIKKVGQFGQGVRAVIRVYGLLASDIADLSMLTFALMTTAKNHVSVLVGEEGDEALTEVFYGDIIQAFPDFKSMPEVPMTIEAIPSYVPRLEKAEPLSFPDQCDVSVAMKQIAGAMGLGFEDYGVNEKLSASYFPGTLWNQAVDIAKAADIIMHSDGRTLSIAKNGGAFVHEDGTVDVPLITKDSGLVGYPSLNQVGIAFQTEYNPAIKFYGRIKMQQDLAICNGEWIVISLDYILESEMPGGAWYCNVVTARWGIGPTNPN